MAHPLNSTAHVRVRSTAPITARFQPQRAPMFFFLLSEAGGLIARARTHKEWSLDPRENVGIRGSRDAASIGAVACPARRRYDLAFCPLSRFVPRSNKPGTCRHVMKTKSAKPMSRVIVVT